MAGFYTTSHAFDIVTTSTVALLVWESLSHSLLERQAPMTAEEVAEAVGISPEQAEAILNENYYQRFYGFRRFETVEAFEAWAKESGVTGSPEPELEDETDEAPADEDDAE